MLGEDEVPLELIEGTALQRYAYVRFAEGLLRWAPPVLGSVGLPNDVALRYDWTEQSPWIFSVAIGPKRDVSGSLVGFELVASPLTPAFILAICAHFLEAVAGAGQPSWAREATEFRAHVRRFGAAYGAAARAFRASGLTAAIDAFYSAIGLTEESMGAAVNHFDICSHFVTNHEMAHAYSGQMTLALGITSEVDARGFEHICDALAAEWLYNLFIRETPDDSDYRAAFGHATHREAIRANTFTVYRSQLMVLLILMFASALNSDGCVKLAGGRNHPHTIVRHDATNAHLATLVLSNQDQHLVAADFDELDAWLQEWLEMFVVAGLISQAELAALASPSRLADMKAAGALIRRCQIESLYGLARAIDLLPDRLRLTSASS